MTAVWSSHVDAALEPYPEEEENVVEGSARAGMHVLRETRTAAGGQLVAGVWESQPCTIDLTFEGDETVHVLSGRATVEVGDETVEMTPGTISSFASGESARWRIHEPFRQFFVLNIDP